MTTFAFFAAKHGQGTSTTAAALAVHLSNKGDKNVALVDLNGSDLRSIMGYETVRPLVTSEVRRSNDMLGPCLFEAVEGNDIAKLTAAMELFFAGSQWDHVVFDVGTVAPAPDEEFQFTNNISAAVLTGSDSRVLVTRACYLAMRKFNKISQALRHLGQCEAVLIHEEGRALTVWDVEVTLGFPVVATIKSDPTVARAVDAGTLATRKLTVMMDALRQIAAV